VPFLKFGIKLREGQSADTFMVEVEKRVNLMIGEYTMNEYKGVQGAGETQEENSSGFY
jgi:hypothetical protein